MKNIKILENLNEIKSIDEQKQLIDSNQPFSNELENKIFQKLKLDWNYNSNAIEGNQLSYGETVAFLNFGLTAKGKPFKDHLDIKGHNEAIGFMLQLIKENRPLSESDIKDLHKIILVEPYASKTISPQGIEFEKEIKIGQYKTSPNHVKTVSGDIHYYTNPEEVPFEMNNLLEWYRNAEDENLHPVIISAIFHHKFTSIHPFDDGNGRLARILSNFILLKHQYPVIVIKNKDKIQYYSALNIADNGIYEDLVKLFAENIGFSLDIMQKAINGENINEVDDLDKEIELFTKEMQLEEKKLKLLKKEDFEKMADYFIDTYINDYFEYLIPKMNKIAELFQELDFSFLNNNQFNNNQYFPKINSDNCEIIIDNQIFDGINFNIDFNFKNFKAKEFNIELSLSVSININDVDYIFKDKNQKILFEEKILYSKNPRSGVTKITKNIINYLMNEIKKHSKN